jgi:thiamine kinase-like enzyme
MDRKYKLSGKAKKYRENESLFVKYYDVETELRAEAVGCQMARKAGLPVTEIEAIDDRERSIAFKRIDWLRLDQFAREKGNHEEHLEFVRLCGQWIVKLHQHYIAQGGMNYSLQRERLIRLQNDLCIFQDITSNTAKKVINQISEALARYKRLQSRTVYIHGDFIHQNIFCSDGYPMVIVFDWENSCYSDPVYDLSTFISFFLIIAVKSNFYTIEDVNLVEQVLLDIYSEQMTLSELDMERYSFFKFLGHHCMYWYYLLILQKFSQKFNDGRIERFFEGSLNAVEVKELVSNLSEEGFRFKPSSFKNIYELLRRSSSSALDLFKFPSIQIC